MSIKLKLKPFYFMRHGETDANRRGTYMGSNNALLNATGEQQARHAAELLVDEGITVIAASPLLRARRTAEIVAERLKVDGVTVIRELAECCLGELEGQQVHESHNLMAQWDSGNHPSGAESLPALEDRIIAVVNKALNLQALDSNLDSKILIVGHGGTYSVLRNLLNYSGTYLPNCGIVFHRPPAPPETQWLVSRLDEDSDW